MTTEQALELLNQLRLRIEMNGKDHELAKQAYETLKAHLESGARAAAQSGIEHKT